MVALALLSRARARKTLLLLALAVAIGVGLVATFRVALFPPSLAQKEPSYFVAITQRFIDSGRSAISDSLVAPDLLASRGPVYAALANSDEIKGAIAREAGLPERSFQIQALQAENPRDRSGGPSLPIEAAATEDAVVRIRATGGPILTIAGQADSPGQAQALAEATGAALAAYVERTGETEATPSPRQITLRPLGRPTIASAGERKGFGDALKVAIPVWLGLGFLILAVDMLVQLRRRELARIADREAHAPPAS